MSSRDPWLAVLAVLEAIALLAFVFVLAGDDRTLEAFGALVAVVVLCIVALRLIGSESFTWLDRRLALVLLAGANLLGVLLLLTTR